MNEKNRFDQNRFAILERSHKERETFEISALAWALENEQTDFAEELLEWMRYLVMLESGSVSGENLLPDYFVSEKPDEVPDEE